MALLEQILIQIDVNDGAAIASTKRVEASLRALGAAADAVASPITSVMETVARSQELTSAALKGLARDSRTGARGLTVLGGAASALLTDLEKLEPTLTRQAEQIRTLAEATAALRRARAQADGAPAARASKLPEATPNFGPVQRQLGGIGAAAQAAGVDVKALGGDVTKLGKALDSATDPINELRNGIDGLGDRLVLFGGQGERLRNEIEEIRDPALRAKIANEQWAAAQGNLNGVIGKASDQLQVAKVRAASYVGGLDNLNKLTLAGVAATGLLVAGLVKLGGALVNVVAKGYQEAAKSQEDYNRRTALAEAQTQSLYQEIGVLAGEVLKLKDKEDALDQSRARGADLLAALTERYKGLPPVVQAGTKAFVETTAALTTGNYWIKTLAASEEELAAAQRETSQAVRETTALLDQQERSALQLSVAHKALGATLGQDVGATSRRVNEVLKDANSIYKDILQTIPDVPRGGGGGRRLSLLEKVLGESYWAEIEEGQRWLDTLRGISAEIDRTRAARDAAAPQVDAGPGALQAGIAGALESVTSVSSAWASELEANTVRFEAQIALADKFKRSLLDVGIAAGAGFAALALGAGTGGEVFGSFLSNLGQLASSLGSTLILAGAGFAALPLGFSAGGAIAAGVGLVALGAGLGVAGAGASAGSTGGAGGATSSASSSLGAQGITPPTAADQRGPRETRIVLQLGAVEVGEVVMGALADAASRGALPLGVSGGR